jgi:hypothetical protein
MSRRRVFRGVTYRNIEHLWSDSSDDDDENGRMNNPLDVEMIDLTGLYESSESSANNTVTTSTQTYELLPLSAPFPSQSPSLPPPIIIPEQIRQQQQIIPSYVPRTLQPFGRRYMILPAFPTSFYDLQPPLLLANVPGIF